MANNHDEIAPNREAPAGSSAAPAASSSSHTDSGQPTSRLWGRLALTMAGGNQSRTNDSENRNDNINARHHGSNIANDGNYRIVTVNINGNNILGQAEQQTASRIQMDGSDSPSNHSGQHNINTEQMQHQPNANAVRINNEVMRYIQLQNLHRFQLGQGMATSPTTYVDDTEFMINWNEGGRIGNRNRRRLKVFRARRK